MQLFAQMKLKTSFNKVGQELISHSQPLVPNSGCTEQHPGLWGNIYNPSWVENSLSKTGIAWLEDTKNKQRVGTLIWFSLSWAVLDLYLILEIPPPKFQQGNLCFSKSSFPGQNPHFVMSYFGHLILVPERIQGKIINEHWIWALSAFSIFFLFSPQFSPPIPACLNTSTCLSPLLRESRALWQPEGKSRYDKALLQKTWVHFN